MTAEDKQGAKAIDPALLEKMTPEERKAVETMQNLSEEDVKNMSYDEYMRLMHPNASEEELQKMIRKERRYTLLNRFELLAFVLFAAVVIFFLFTR